MADHSFEPHARSLVSQGLTLNYWDWGNEAAPLLALIHGNGDHGRSWDRIARAFAQDYHVVALDLRGHGESQWSPDGAYMTPYFVLDFVNLVEALGEPENFIVLAHSFGGVVAMRYAAMYPARPSKLILVDGLGPAPPIRAQWEAEGVVARARGWIEQRRGSAIRAAKRLASIEDAAKRLQKDRPRLSDEWALHLARHGVRPDGDGFAWKRDPLVSVFGHEDFALEMDAVRAHVSAPTLLFWGKESWSTHPGEDGRASAIRDHRIIAYQDAGHWLHHDQADRFIADAWAFLSGG